MNKKLKEQVGNAGFDVMALPDPRAFVVVRDKTQDFKNTKSNPDIVKRNHETTQRLRINDFTQTGKPKRKIRKRE